MESQISTALAEITSEPKKGFARRIRYHAYRTLLGVWKFTVGVAFTQTFVASFLAAGWTFRAAQRAIAQYWWKASSVAKSACFCEFAQTTSFHRGEGGWPNWILQQDRAWMRAHRMSGPGKARAIVRSLFYSLWLNLKIGVQTMFNTLVLTLPGCALMLFAWYAGWQNSFNKGYEQAAIGPATGFAGILLFIAAMCYVPMAQMRQASTGDWRSFYQFKTVWQLFRKRWLACCGLAMLFSALSIPVTALKTAPQFFPQINPALAELSPAKAFEFARAYYFFAAFAFFGACLLLRIVAARVYASSVLACIQTGALAEEALAEREWEMLHRLDLLAMKPQRARHILVRTVAWFGTKLGRATVAVVLFLSWFSFVGQIYISEFLMKSESGRGWLNQPLVQLPWFNYVPSQLKRAARDGSDTTERPPEWQGRRF